MKVSNMTSYNGNKVPNQFIITGCPAGTFNLASKPTDFDNEYNRLGSGDLFQSYKSNIAYIDYMGNVYLDSVFWDYSRTTSKYRNNFLDMNIAEVKAGIKDGSIKLVDLN